MFGKFSVNRFAPSVMLLLMAALSAQTGCRWLSATSPASSPPFSPSVITPLPLPKAEAPDRYSAFRPIMAEPFAQPLAQPAPVRIIPVPPLPQKESQSELPKTESPDSESNAGAAAQLQIDELNKKVADLESQLADAQQPSPVFDDPMQTQKLETEAMPDALEIQKLPIINKRGVTVSADELRRVRIAVVDKVLFMPNAWQLTPEGEETLRDIAAEIRAFDSNAHLDIEGHTDSLMSDPRNPTQKHDISSMKAKTVMDFFVNTLRWDAARMGSSSFGRSRPVADNGTPEGREKNNRIEVVLRKQSGE